MIDEVRKPAVAWQFYEGNPAALREEIETMLSEAGKSVPGEILALISPHAAYSYSGRIAACGFSLLEQGQYETVVVISPSHVEYFPYASVFNGKSYLTPLGEIQVDGELARRIAEGSNLIRLDYRGHVNRSGGRNEHALEVQLPFLQVAIGEFKLVPIVMGDQSQKTVEELGRALSTALKDKSALIVASTDLSHFHDDRSARRLDGTFIEALERFDEAQLLSALESGKAEACGGGPAAAAMIAAKALGADACTVLCQANSGDVTGEQSSVVGYVSAAMTRKSASGKGSKMAAKDARSARPGPKSQSRIEPGNGREVPDEARKFLLGYARAVIESRLAGKDPGIEIPDYPVLAEKRGGFVTLRKRGELRGCIGYIEAIKPLADTVAEMAEAAAFSDYRFRKVTADELGDISIEISVLSPIREITDPSSIIVGKHGIIISRGPNRGLLLPQVATEWKWDRDTFLDQTCIKAGLSAGTWKKPGTKIEIFSAEVFSEDEMGMR